MLKTVDQMYNLHVFCSLAKFKRIRIDSCFASCTNIIKMARTILTRILKHLGKKPDTTESEVVLKVTAS